MSFLTAKKEFLSLFSEMERAAKEMEAAGKLVAADSLVQDTKTFAVKMMKSKWLDIQTTTFGSLPDRAGFWYHEQRYAKKGNKGVGAAGVEREFQPNTEVQADVAELIFSIS